MDKKSWAYWAGEQLGNPGEFIFAQWQMETADFTSPLARNNNNYAGLKDIHGNWRDFSSDEDFARGYVKFLSTPRYRDARGQTDFWAWIRGLGRHDGRGGYYGNESPESYGKKVQGWLGKSTGQPTKILPSEKPLTIDPVTEKPVKEKTDPKLIVFGLAAIIILAIAILFSVGLQGVV